MGLFDFLKSKKDDTSVERPHLQTGTSDGDLKKLIGKAIAVFENSPGASADTIIKGIESHTRNEDLAVALYRFIPIAFCRIILPEPAYSDEYVIADKKNGDKSYSFSSDKVYNAVLTESREYLAQEPDQEKVVNVLVNSADFDAINKALHGGSELKDLVFGPSVFL